MMANDTFSITTKWNEKRMEENEGLRTVDCLRGRLQAERTSSKAANDESEQIGKKLIELEKQLKIEIKSRNKAEKRLNFLLKKLDSLNISYDVSTDDQSSCFSEKSEGSSFSSSCKSQHQMELQNPQFTEEAISENLKDDDEYQLYKDNSHGSKSLSTTNNHSNEKHDRDIDHNVDNSMALIIVEDSAITKPTKDEDSFDNSMALVVVDSRVAKERQEVPTCSTNVKDVLDALRYARESLQTSIEMKKHMKSNVTQSRLNKISC
ncbi:uncharacterized protein [Rutidosis leptorrhynchoides]|uniref:uncharacterized protein n=1 Tax=Rutidosis leptorrhynchoides TaxID=125765 RepID=UPI003A99E637